MFRPRILRTYDSTFKPRVLKTYDSTFKNRVLRTAGPLNPYAGVNWGTSEYIIGSTHMHTRQQLTESTRDEMFDFSYDAGIRSMGWSEYYDEEPITDGDAYFNPDPPSDAVILENSEQHRCSNTKLHYCPVGSLQSRYGSYSTPISREGTWESMFAEAFKLMIWEDAGGITLNHPSWTNVHDDGDLTVDKLCRMLDYDKRVLGIEVYNHKTEVIPDPAAGWSISQWDEILSTGRRCWGFWVTDGYDERIHPDPALGFSVLLIDENTAYKAARAYRQGHFYGSMKPTGLKFTDIQADLSEVSFSVNETATLKFITEDGLAQSSTGISDTYTVDSDQVYVRCEALKDNGERIFAQPIMYN